MKIILIAILLMTIVLYGAFALAYKIDGKDAIKISYDRFIKLYFMNPNKWETHLDYCVFYEPYCDYRREQIYFKSYFDVLKFRNFKRKKESVIINSNNNKRMAKLISYWQDDINEYKQNYYYEMQRMSEELKEYEQKTKEKIKTLELHYVETAEKE